MCTANVCRSPMAQVLLEAQLESHGVEARVGSAGVLPGGRPAAPEAVDVMARRGLDLSGHVSRQASRADIERADLVVCMAREHVREVVLADPGAWERTFTLKELLRRGSQTGPRRPGQDLAEWVAKAHVGRERRGMLGESAWDDVADPVGMPLAAFEVTADQLSGLVDRFVGLLWSPA